MDTLTVPGEGCNIPSQHTAHDPCGRALFIRHCVAKRISFIKKSSPSGDDFLDMGLDDSCQVQQVEGEPAGDNEYCPAQA